MRKKLIFRIALCAIMASLSIVLDKVGSIEVGARIKITFYALPLLVVGITNGMVYGLITGAVTGLVLQLTSPWGIGPTSIFWGLAPVVWGGLSGAITYLLKKTPLKNKRLIVYAIAIFLASLGATIMNTFAMYMDSLLVKDSYYTFASIVVDLPLRLLTMIVTYVPYVIITSAVCTGLAKAIFEQNTDEELE